MKKLLLAITIGLLCASANAGVVGYDWQNYNGHEYALTIAWDSWVALEQEAVSAGGHLVTINGDDENAWLATQFANTYARDYSGNPMVAAVCIGYYYNGSSWQWSSGEPVTYTNYYSGFPGGGTHAYLHVPPHSSSPTWNANPFHTEVNSDPGYMFKGIIERSVVPEPSSLLAIGSGMVSLLGLLRRRR